MTALVRKLFYDQSVPQERAKKQKKVLLKHTAQAKKIIEVNASKSREVLVTGLTSLAFKACSGKQTVVTNISSLTRQLPSISRSMRLTLHPTRS